MQQCTCPLSLLQDTLVAMEALFEYTLVDPNRNVFDILIQLERSASPNWRKLISMNRDNYTNLVETYVSHCCFCVCLCFFVFCFFVVVVVLHTSELIDNDLCILMAVLELAAA